MLTKCKICDALYFWKRDHCPACGARRVLPASPDSPITHIQSCENLDFPFHITVKREIVRGLVSDYSFSVIYKGVK